MDKEVLYFQNMKPSDELIEEIFNYDVRTLETTNDITLSKYAIALAQYLVYFKSQTNRTKVDSGRKKRVLDSGVNQLITKEVLREYKTKADAMGIEPVSIPPIDFIFSSSLTFLNISPQI